MAEYIQEISKYFPAIIPFVFPEIPGVSCHFTTGLYGNITLDSDFSTANDIERRAALAPVLGFSGWTEMHQVHGDTLLVEPELTSYQAASDKDADGACTSRPGHAIAVKSADCQPIMLAHKSGKYVAGLHCGWKGNSIDFPQSGVESFCAAYNIKAEEVAAVRGPSLGPGAAEFVNFENEWPDKFRPWFNASSRCMDLWSLTRYQLMQAGVKAENIYSIDLCTYMLSSMLFSFRRGHAGRQASIIFINS